MTSPARITIDVEWPTQPTPELEEDITVRSMEHFEDAICRLAPDFGGRVTKVYGEWIDPAPRDWICDYEIRSAIDGGRAVLHRGRVTVIAQERGDVAALAIETVHNNVAEADPRVEPVVTITHITEMG